MTLEFVGSPNSNGDVQCRCPLGTHTDNNPSASYNVKTGLFYCFTCKQGLNREQLEKRIGKITGVPSIQAVSPTINRRHKIDDDWLDRYYRSNAYPASIETLNHIVNRRLPIESTFWHTYQVGFTDDRIIFPFYNSRGDVVATQERNLGDSLNFTGRKYILKGDAKGVFLWPNAPELLPDRKSYIVSPVYLTEGVFGALKLRLMGMRAFAVLGTKLTIARKVIMTLTGVFNISSDEIITVFDSDDPGQVAALHYMREGAKAYLPGCEADEIDPKYAKQFKSLVDSSSHTMLEWRTRPDVLEQVVNPSMHRKYHIE